jgi:hypothetical protein
MFIVTGLPPLVMTYSLYEFSVTCSCTVASSLHLGYGAMLLGIWCLALQDSMVVSSGSNVHF